MAAQTTEATTAGPSWSPRSGCAVPDGAGVSDLRASCIVWKRELIRFRTDRLRAITSLIQPFLFLFVLGTGLSTLAGKGLPTGRELQDLHLPGRPGHVGAFHRGLLGGLDRVGP